MKQHQADGKYPLEAEGSCDASCMGSSIRMVPGSTMAGLPIALLAGADDEAPGSCGKVKLIAPVP